jgi:hypothetical protein
MRRISERAAHRKKSALGLAHQQSFCIGPNKSYLAYGIYIRGKISPAGRFGAFFCSGASIFP